MDLSGPGIAQFPAGGVGTLFDLRPAWQTSSREVGSVLFGSNDNRLDLIIGEYLPQITAGIQRELLGQVLKDND